MASQPIYPGLVIKRLTVIERDSEDRRRWICACECGARKSILAGNLQSGRTHSCGCYNREIATRSGTVGVTLRTDPAYEPWRCMRKRCSNPNATGYGHYGGRGITVCDRWSDFRSFLADMGPRPPGTSIDRIDVDGNYEPSNCRWASGSVQASNRRIGIPRSGVRLTPENIHDILRLTADGIIQTALAVQFGVSQATICKVIKRERQRLAA